MLDLSSEPWLLCYSVDSEERNSSSPRLNSTGRLGPPGLSYN